MPPTQLWALFCQDLLLEMVLGSCYSRVCGLVYGYVWCSCLATAFVGAVVLCVLLLLLLEERCPDSVHKTYVCLQVREPLCILVMSLGKPVCYLHHLFAML